MCSTSSRRRLPVARPVVAVCLAAVAASGSFAPDRAAAQELFWTAVNEYPDFRIRTSALDGANTHDIVTGIDTDLGDIVIDPPEERLYWVERAGTGSRIRSAALDGSAVEPVHESVDSIGSLAIDPAGRALYFVASELLGPVSIRRLRLDEGDVEPLLFTEAGDLALDPGGAKFYWVEEGLPEEGRGADIWRANLDGSEAERVIHHVFEHTTTGITIDADGGTIYWATVDYRDTHAQIIWRADLDGANPEPLVTANPGLDDWPVFMDIDPAGGKLHWVNGEDGEFYRADLTGGEAQFLFEDSGSFGPFGLAVLRAAGPPPVPARFRRGDADADGALTLIDPLFTANALFLRSAELLCLDAADVNDDGEIDIGDVVASLHHQFLGVLDIPPPGPLTCGADPTGDDPLGCAGAPPCAE